MHKLYFTFVFALLGLWSYGQTNDCENFNTSVGNWQTSAATITISSAGSTSDGTPYMRGADGASVTGSWIFNQTDYTGDLGDSGGGCLCWDYKVFDDGAAGSPNMTPRIFMYQGTATNMTLSARFLATNVIITENSPWVTICAPLRGSTTALPANNDGAWVISTGNVADWNTLLSNVSGVAFHTDVAGSSSQDERIGIDNFCFSEDYVIFGFEDENGNEQTEFCVGEDVYLDGSLTATTGSYYLDIWELNNDGTLTWLAEQNTNGWQTGAPTLINITELFENDPDGPLILGAGKTYYVKLAVNSPCGWLELMHGFTIIDCCEQFDEVNFDLGVDFNYNFWVGNYNGYEDINGVHEWYVLSSPNPGAGPYTPEYSTTTTGSNNFMLFSGGQFGVYYTIIHKVISDCGEICYAQEQYQQEGRSPEEYTNTRAVEIDCCFVFDYWSGGPGDPQEFTAEFNIGVDLSGMILTQVLYDYSNEIQQWFLLSSPNPTGGPYSFVDSGTGVNYTYGPIQDEIYYFLIRKVISDCGEVCFGQSICINCGSLRENCELCGPIDCRILDDIIPECQPLAAPTNLQVNGWVLTWDPVPGAASYIVSSPPGPQISCHCQSPISIVPITTTTNSLLLPASLRDKCFVWMVTAVCRDGTQSDPSRQECYIPHGGGGKDYFGKAKITPNPNSGNMNITVETSYNAEVRIEVYDFYGKLVESFVENLSANTPVSIHWAASGKLAKGVYFVTFKTDLNSWSKKVIVH